MLEFSKKKGKYYRFLLSFRNLKDKTGIYIGKGSKIANNTIISDGSRINGKIIIKGKGSCILGKFVAFGDGIKIITSNHKLTSVVLQYKLQLNIGNEPEVDKKKNVEIGNNVWIGDNAIILPGVIIGDGAIIGAGSIVTKDIPAYGIAAGAPARFIKYRFSSEKINELEKLNWHNWSIEEMKKNNYMLK